MAKNWYRLDTAGLIFPAIARRDWSNAFRVSATLDEPIDPDTLQRAADDLRPRFPSFYVTLRKGAFWYYLEHSSARVLVRQDYAYPLSFMSSAELKQNCLRILYYQNRIAVECFHSLSDGRGGSVFLCTLAARYLELRHGLTIPPGGMVADLSQPPPPEELEDSFLKNAAPVAASRREEKSYLLHGTVEGLVELSHRIDITHPFKAPPSHGLGSFDKVGQSDDVQCHPTVIMIAVTGIICLLPSACFGNEVTLNLALKELLVLHHDLHHLSFACDGFVDQGTLVGFKISNQ